MIYRIAVNNIEYGSVVIKANSEEEAKEAINEAVEKGFFYCNDSSIEFVNVDEVAKDIEYKDTKWVYEAIKKA